MRKRKLILFTILVVAIICIGIAAVTSPRFRYPCFIPSGTDIDANNLNITNANNISATNKKIANGTILTKDATVTVCMNDYSCDFTCDGTDDQVEIQAAIDALPSGRGRIVLSTGKFYTTAPIFIKQHGTVIEGQSPSASQIVADFNGAILKTDEASIIYPVIKSLSFTQKTTNLLKTTKQGVGIDLTHYHHAHLEDLWFTHLATGIKFHDGYYNTVENCRINNVDIGYDINANQQLILGGKCIPLENQIGMKISRYGVTIIGTTFESSPKPGQKGILIIEGSANIIEGVWCEGIETGIEIAAGVKDTVIINPIFQSCRTRIIDNGTHTVCIGQCSWLIAILMFLDMRYEMYID